MDLKQLQENDTLIRMVERESGNEALSPMDPPDAYKPPVLDEVPLEDMAPFLQDLMQEHVTIKELTDQLEETLGNLQSKGLSKEVNKEFQGFFERFDDIFIKHNRKEESEFFPLLKRRLIKHGEHSQGLEKTTAVDMLEDDHVRGVQQLALVFNFLAMGMQLPDEASRLLVLDTAVNQAKLMVEELRLHIFREENVVFPLAHKYLTREEFDYLASPM